MRSRLSIIIQTRTVERVPRLRTRFLPHIMYLYVAWAALFQVESCRGYLNVLQGVGGVLWKSSHGHGYTYSVLDMSQPDLDEIALYNMYTLDPLDLLTT